MIGFERVAADFDASPGMFGAISDHVWIELRPCFGCPSTYYGLNSARLGDDLLHASGRAPGCLVPASGFVWVEGAVEWVALRPGAGRPLGCFGCRSGGVGGGFAVLSVRTWDSRLES